MGIDANTLAKLRDELNVQKGAYNEAVKNNKASAEEIKKLLQDVSPETLKVLRDFGFNTEDLVNLDVDKLITDREALAQLQHGIETVSEKIIKNMEEVLGVNVSV